MPRDSARHPLDDRIRAVHMLDAARDAAFFAKGRIRKDLDTDRMLLRAIVHAIQEIGEASSRISEAGRSRLPGIPWKQIVGMRHRLVHAYSEINVDLVWEVVITELAPLIASLEKALAAWPEPPPPNT